MREEEASTILIWFYIELVSENLCFWEGTVYVPFFNMFIVEIEQRGRKKITLFFNLQNRK